MRSDGQHYLCCDECGEYVNSSEAGAHRCAKSDDAEGEHSGFSEDLRKLAVLILAEDNGIGEKAWNALQPMLIAAGHEEIARRVDATDGRFYLPESKDEEDAK